MVAALLDPCISSTSKTQHTGTDDAVHETEEVSKPHVIDINRVITIINSSQLNKLPELLSMFNPGAKYHINKFIRKKSCIDALYQTRNFKDEFLYQLKKRKRFNYLS